MTGTIERPHILTARDAVNGVFTQAMTQFGALRQRVTSTGRAVANTIAPGEAPAARPAALAHVVRELTGKQLTAVNDAREAVLPAVSATASRLTFAMNFPGTDPHPPMPEPVTPARRVFYVHEPPLPDTARYADASARPIVRLGTPSAPSEQQGAPTCTINAVMSGVRDLRPRWYDRTVRRDPHGGYVSTRVAHGEYLMYDTLPVGVDSGELIYATSSDGTAVAPFLEKAWAGHNTYGGAEPAAVLRWMIGSGETVPTSTLSSDDLRDLALDPDKLAIMWVPETKHPGIKAQLAQHGVIPRHSYYLADLTPDGKYVQHNPWNVDHPKDAEEAAFRAMYHEVTWGDLHEIDAMAERDGR